MRWNKKSQSIVPFLFFVFFGVILAFFFVIMVMGRVKASVDDSTYHKRFYSKDLALLVDSLHAANGNFEINYEISLPEKMKLDFELQKDKVVITDHSNTPPDQRVQTAFLFGYNDYVEIIPVNMSSDVIKFYVVASNKNITFKPSNVVYIGQSGQSVGGGGGGGGGGSVG